MSYRLDAAISEFKYLSMTLYRWLSG